eukprot:scaffold11298_cov50-Attheya_sp.AAC.4
MDGSIHGWRNGCRTWWFVGISWVAAEVVVAARATSCLGFGKVRGITVDLEAHVAGDEAHGGLGFGGAVVEKLGKGLGFGLGIFAAAREPRATSMVESTARA